jgi:hypothetical protein
MPDACAQSSCAATARFVPAPHRFSEEFDDLHMSGVDLILSKVVILVKK